MYETKFSRRALLGWMGAAAAVSAFGYASRSVPVAAQSFRISYSDAEWRRRLTSAQYAVLREESTERAFTSPLNDEHREGIFVCAGCANELFSSETKYDSGTGWPSFYRPLPGAIGQKIDHKLGYPRTEVHCADCGGHQGHVFRDGPRPTGLRYCINGLAMNFRPA
jgi:peptide-methionine (R)-S-oxide reductase